MGSPNSVLIKVNNKRFRSSINTGAELCLINSKIFHTLPNAYVSKLKKSDVHLQSVNWGSLEIEGKVDLTFQLGSLTMSHPFYVVQGMNRNCILGRDWLIQNGVRIYYDLGTMRINDVCVPLQKDIHISSVLRIAKSVVLKPQAAQICLAKYKSALDVSPNEVLSVSKIDQSFVNENPGLFLNETLATATAKNRIPVLLKNATNETYKLKKGCVIGRVDKLGQDQIQSIEFQTREINEIDVYNLEVHVPEEHKVKVEQLIKNNKDLFAEIDLDLSHTIKVTMKIDTGNCKPIELKS